MCNNNDNDNDNDDDDDATINENDNKKRLQTFTQKTWNFCKSGREAKFLLPFAKILRKN